MARMHLEQSSYDVVVVGAGPAGAKAAQTAAEHGLSVLLLEWRPEVGLPVQCTGLLSLRGFEAAGVGDEVKLGPMRGAYVYGPQEQSFALESPRTQAYVMDRDRFDAEIVQNAEAAGTEVHTRARAIHYEPGDPASLRLRLHDRDEVTIRTRIVIGGDGPKSDVARWAGLDPPRKRIVASQVTIPYELDREDYVEVHLNRRVAPNFFGWAVPSMPGCARVGLGTDHGKQTNALLERWLRERFGDPEILQRFGGEIPIGPAERTVADGVMLVGDAAGHAKPTSGGGIYIGTSCGRLAGDVAAEAIGADDVSARRLDAYERRWRARFERELTFGYLAHRALCRLSDDDLDRVFQTVTEDEALMAILSEHGDIDYTSWVAQALVKRPALWRRLMSAVPRKRDFLMEAIGLVR